MAHFGTGVEYALHCLLWLVETGDAQPSSRDLAKLQGAPQAFVAKLFPKLEKAGLVAASPGLHGGYRLARAAEKISVLDVVDAIEGKKSLFDCQQVRGRCALFQGKAPSWSGRGVCGIHAVMIEAEERMRESLAATTLAQLSAGARGKAPASFEADVRRWFADRSAARGANHREGLRRGRSRLADG